MATQAQITAVQQLYVSYLGRAADKAGLDFWSNAIANGTSTIESVATGLTLATEYTTAYGNLSNDALVDAVYTNVLGRSADAAGKAFWVAAFGNGTVKADTFVASLIQSLGAQDQATINNKTFVAQTYTDTVGDAYTPAGGAAVLTGVTNDPATVNTAIAAINTGTLPGQVPGLALINALHAATDAVTAYGTTAATANASLDANKDGVLTSAEADTALTAATGDRTAVSADSTTVLTAKSSDAAQAAAASKALVSAATGGAAAVAAYDAAVAANKAAVAAVDANATAGAANAAGLNTALKVTGATVSYDTVATAAGKAAGAFTNVDDIVTFLNDSATSPTLRSAVVTELNKVDTYGAGVVKTADLSLASAKADFALNDATTGAKAKLLAIDTDSNASGVQATDYVTKTDAAVAAADKLAKAQAADVKVAGVQAVVDQYKTLNKGVADASKAITDFETANSTKVDIHAIGAGAVAQTGDATKADVFYFSSKVATANDGTIGTFGAGDSLVLGNTLSFNSGALSTGDNNKAEFFLVQKGSDTLVVLETANFGSSTTLHTATGDTAAVTSPDAAVITLTGVNVADLTVSNGVVSHVA